MDVSVKSGITRENNKKRFLYAAALNILVGSSNISIADGDARQLVMLPDIVQQHMLSNMRDHLVAINEILIKATLIKS